jgi:hypothetical protein
MSEYIDTNKAVADFILRVHVLNMVAIQQLGLLINVYDLTTFMAVVKSN